MAERVVARRPRSSAPTPLTSDDLDDIGIACLRVDDPRPHRRRLLDAVEQGRLADPADASYALALASEISERLGEEDDALALSIRATESAADDDEGRARRGHHADLLLQFGRAEEAMAILRDLRPQLTRDPAAVNYVIDALTEHGRSELAEQWLTAAMTTASERAEQVAPDTEDADDAWEIADGLVMRRRVVRRELGLEPDEADLAADAMLAELAETPELLFWPEAAFAEIVGTRSEDVVGRTWDEHRAMIEGELQAADEEGERVLVEVATPEVLAAVLAGDDLDDVDTGPLLAWPPGRNDPCWCGSRVKYKKCCLPRGRI